MLYFTLPWLLLRLLVKIDITFNIYIQGDFFESSLVYPLLDNFNFTSKKQLQLQHSVNRTEGKEAWQDPPAFWKIILFFEILFGL
jgi:hypothetical protein